jgi:hypothetical protein
MIAAKLFKNRNDSLTGWGFPVFVGILAFEMSGFDLVTWDRGRVNSIMWVLLGMALSLRPQWCDNAAETREGVVESPETYQETDCALPAHAFSPAECND